MADSVMLDRFLGARSHPLYCLVLLGCIKELELLPYMALVLSRDGLMILTRHNETGAVALPRLTRVAVACGASVVIQPILRQHVKNVQGSCGCDEISLSWKTPKQERTTMIQCVMQQTKTLKRFPDVSRCADFFLSGTFRKVY